MRPVSIRDTDADVYAALQRRAVAQGISVPELLRRHATSRPSHPDPSARSERPHRRRTAAPATPQARAG